MHGVVVETPQLIMHAMPKRTDHITHGWGINDSVRGLCVLADVHRG